jgi:hypothetical protein
MRGGLLNPFFQNGVDLYGNGYSSSQGGGTLDYVIPAAFSTFFTSRIWTDGSDVFTDYDFDQYKNQIVQSVAYVDFTDGVDQLSGGAIGAPFKTMAYAVARTGFNTYRVKTGIRGNFTTSVFNITRSMIIEPWGDGYVEFSSQVPTALSWSANGTFPDVYQATNPNAPTTVISSGFDQANLNVNGNYIALSRQTSLANCNANLGSYFYETGTNTVYVRTFDSRMPDANVCMLLTGRCLNLSATLNTVDQYVHLEKIKSYCGFPLGITNPGTKNWYFGAEDCEFSYSEVTRDGAYISVNARAIGHFLNCQSWYNQKDALNYDGTSGATIGTFFFEWGTRSGYTNTTGNAHNGSTCHANMRLIRVKGNYQFTVGKPVQDVQNSKTLSIRCVAGNSLGPNPDNYAYSSNSFVDGTSTEMWLYECQHTGSAGRGFRNFANSIMNIYDGDYGNLLTATNLEEPGSVTNILTEEDVFQ